ncbi:hypothetical protein PHJA_001886600 [Phtheirospermum japonicum]|uniref:Uncharacterized protein n=1 Tax=Phtheirospermum japonicum TaxID=374723 RepID=A0A830CQX1_9LAMI|nr:hypothetical protein PHJA_001886600 [Phtheirospermum japonicum]
MERETEQEADERREAAIASSASLQPNFKPKRGLTESQLAKFQELHKRRLQIKAKSKAHKRDKGLGDGKSKPHKTAVEAHDCTIPIKPPILQSKMGSISSLEEGKVAGNSAANKRQKLHWGRSGDRVPLLDAKERWERKSNM